MNNCRFAVLLKDLGLEKGDIIHLVIGNANLTFPISFGAWILGGIVSHGDVNLEPKSIAGQLVDTKAKLVCCTPQTAPSVKEAVQLVTPDILTKICSLGDVEGCKNLTRNLALVDVEKSPEPYSASNLEDEIAIVFWSSGTTGLRVDPI